MPTRTMEIKTNRTSHDDFKKEALKNPEIKNEYDRIAPVYEIIKQKLKKRMEILSWFE